MSDPPYLPYTVLLVLLYLLSYRNAAYRLTCAIPELLMVVDLNHICTSSDRIRKYSEREEDKPVMSHLLSLVLISIVMHSGGGGMW